MKYWTLPRNWRRLSRGRTRRPRFQSYLLLDPGRGQVEEGIGGGVDYGDFDIVLFEGNQRLILGHGSIGHMGPMGLSRKLIMNHGVRRRQGIRDHGQSCSPIQRLTQSSRLDSKSVQVY
jgi:hypothetical protein